MPCPTLVPRLVRENARQVIGAEESPYLSVSVSWFGNGYLPKPARSAGACVYLRIDEQEAGRNQSSVGCEVQSIQSFPFCPCTPPQIQGELGMDHVALPS
ncbi:hypothetical protein CABS01_16310 [Colletotrichum abscissum]|uniref:uncharacterized protein n=1 Tax=Colletotrichum abscissum TaxID=1671311 RepID=UPI0027D6EDC7|nr:uncharacterized protein CABS01_16310 [Colletotrichum abscissum]KAI3535229.1 hypothetical protein CSPX01_11599 [Colletotrichum filicis]KAK1471665.1 hypothetical protein CABS01_16310 [Colletotrichum abscissum]